MLHLPSKIACTDKTRFVLVSLEMKNGAVNCYQSSGDQTSRVAEAECRSLSGHCHF